MIILELAALLAQCSVDWPVTSLSQVCGWDCQRCMCTVQVCFGQSMLRHVSRANVTPWLNLCLWTINRPLVHRMSSPVSLISTSSALIHRLINEVDREGRTILPRWPVRVTQCNGFHLPHPPPPRAHALSVLDYDADFTPTSSACGYCLLGGAPAPTSSGNGGCAFTLEMFSLASVFLCGYHLLDGAPSSASSGDGVVVSMDGSPSGQTRPLLSSHAFPCPPFNSMVPLPLSVLMTVMPLCSWTDFRLWRVLTSPFLLPLPPTCWMVPLLLPLLVTAVLF